jgi:hypothetical protein
MPPHKLGDLADATYSNVEQMDAAYMASCIRPWLVLWQQQLSRKLISRLERQQQFIEHETHGFLSVDAASRAQLYSSEFNVGSITPNEIRGYENRDPVTGGNRAFVQLNMIPLDKVDDWWDAEIAAKKAPKTPPPAPKIDATDEELNSLRTALADVTAKHEAERILRERAETSLEPEREGRIRAEQKAEDSSERAAELETNLEETRADLSQKIELLDGAQAALAQEQSERAREKAEADELLATAMDARAQAETELKAAEASRDTALASVQLLLSRAEQAEAERDGLKGIKAAHAEQLTRMIAATRGLVFDAMRRIIRKETEKAQRYQATPAKLLEWSRTFYVLHSETCFELLQPAIRAHLAILGRDDVTAVTQSIVSAHIAESVRQLEAAASSEPSEFQAVLARLLNRWETQRADAVADRLLTEGVDHVRAQ